MLRTVVEADGRLRVLPTVPDVMIEWLDCSPSEARAQRHHRVLDVGRWPLFGAALTRGEDSKTYLHFDFDLIIMDARSLHLFFEEWGTLVAGLLAHGSMPALASPPPWRQVVAARDRISPDPHKLDRARAYWEARLSELGDAPLLPYACPLHTIVAPTFEHRERHLSATTTEALQRHARHLGCTVSVMLLAAYAEVLSAFSGPQSACVINVLSSNQPEGVPTAIGDFSSLVLVRVDLGAASFSEMAAAVQQQLWQDLDHGDVGGVEVQRALAARQGRPGAAVLPVVFTGMIGMLNRSVMNWAGQLTHTCSQTSQATLDNQVCLRKIATTLVTN